MPRLLLAALLAVASASGALAQGETPDDGPPPFELRWPQPGDGPLAVTLRMIEALPRYEGNRAATGFLRQQLAQVAGGLGMHSDALRWNDEAFGYRPDSVGVLSVGARAVDAVDEIVRRAENAQVVMVNEAHHDASTRLLTLRLLEPLYAQGYRYLAAETFAPDSILSKVTDYPTAGMGFYSDEPVFGALVREALRLGFTLVPYEEEREDEVENDSLDSQQRRDLSEAQHLAERTVGRDPDARVLVHAGYSHINESPTERFSPMAWYFTTLTGIDPLTVSQTEVHAASEPAYEHPTYRAALAAGLIQDRPVILVDDHGEPLAVSDREVDVDLFVVRPATERPAADLGYGALPPLALPAACGACLVEVLRGDEGPDAVPVDRTTVFEGRTVRMLGPRDVPLVVTVVDGRTGRSLDRRITFAR